MHAALSRKLFDAAVAGMGDELLRLRGWTLTESTYPVLAVTFTHPRSSSRLHVQFECTNWSEQPPSIVFFDTDGTPLSKLPPTPGSQFNNSPHPITGRPFVCMRGSREYHTHPSHLTDHWEQYRGLSENDLGGIVTQVWHAWLAGQP